MKRASGRVWIGTSGWNYPHWRRTFYPPGLPHKQELAYIGSRFGTVEVNGTFYSLTRPSTCEAWRRSVPPGFVFAIKGSRYITHMLKLRNFQAPLGNFFAQGILRLGGQLGPMLWQLPPGLKFDADRARAFFDALPRDVAAAERRARSHDARTTGRSALTAPDGRTLPLRHAVEPRHASWMEDAALKQLEAHDVALVAADTAGKHPFSLARTAGLRLRAPARLDPAVRQPLHRRGDRHLGRPGPPPARRRRRRLRLLRQRRQGARPRRRPPVAGGGGDQRRTSDCACGPLGGCGSH